MNLPHEGHVINPSKRIFLEHTHTPFTYLKKIFSEYPFLQGNKLYNMQIWRWISYIIYFSWNDSQTVKEEKILTLISKHIKQYCMY